MKSEWLAKSPLLLLPIAALFLFVGLFLAVFIFTMKKRPSTFAPVARLPLDDDRTEHDSSKGGVVA